MTYKELIFKAISEPDLDIFVIENTRQFLDYSHTEIMRRADSYGIVPIEVTRTHIKFKSDSTIRYATEDDVRRGNIRGFRNPFMVAGHGLDAEERAAAGASKWFPESF